MSRNLKPDYIRKLIKMEVPKGYKFDLQNYLHNPSYDHEYPSFFKRISEDETTFTMRTVYYFKHYDGSGEYIEQFLTFAKTEVKSGKSSWAIAKGMKENILESSPRFNLKRLVALI